MKRIITDTKKYVLILLTLSLVLLCLFLIKDPQNIINTLKKYVYVVPFLLFSAGLGSALENRLNYNAIFFDFSELIVFKRGRKNVFSYEKLKIAKITKITKYFYIIKFSLSDSDFTFTFILWPPEKESFSQLVKEFVPKEHELQSFVSQYNNLKLDSKNC